MRNCISIYVPSALSATDYVLRHLLRELGRSAGYAVTIEARELHTDGTIAHVNVHHAWCDDTHHTANAASDVIDRMHYLGQKEVVIEERFAGEDGREHRVSILTDGEGYTLFQ